MFDSRLSPETLRVHLAKWMRQRVEMVGKCSNRGLTQTCWANMPYIDILLLAVLQALTEFLPISSSAHLYLYGAWFGAGYQGLIFDLGLHLGTLAAVLAYFRADWLRLFGAVLAWRPGTAMNDDQRLAIGLALATVPGGIAALALGDAGALALRNYLVIGCMQILFGSLLFWAFWRAADAQLGEAKLSIKAALLIGCAQALALIPGVSRSGVTMTAGMLLGLERTAAARFSFLLAVPIIAAAGLHGVVELQRGDSGTDHASFWLGALISAIAGYACIHFFLTMIRRIGMLPFFLYRLALGLGLLVFALSGT